MEEVTGGTDNSTRINTLKMKRRISKHINTCAIMKRKGGEEAQEDRREEVENRQGRVAF